MDAPAIAIELEVDHAPVGWVAHHLRVEERIDVPTRGVVRARSGAWEDVDARLGKLLSVRLVSRDGTERFFHGVITQLEQELGFDGTHELDLVFEAPLAVLRYGRNSRLWLEKTVEEVVDAVLAEAALPHEIRWELRETYEAHAQITQLGESDLDFVARLLHEEGIVLATQSTMDGAVLCLFDDVTRVEPLANDALLICGDAGHRGERAARHLEEHLSVASDETSLRDYDLRAPAADLTSSSRAEASTGREVYVHPGSFQDPARGARLAARELQRLRARCRIVEGVAHHPDLEVARRFELQGADRLDLAGDYVLLGARHEWGGTEDGRYVVRFEAAPLDVPQRPRAAPPPPAQLGTHVGWVTGPPGEEIHTNEYGRVRVRFPWDRSGITSDLSSTWLRVGQLALGGSMILPRVGFEVAVGFELGDLDRPCVIGHLYNVEAPPPYALPGGKTVSSIQTATTGGGGGANELRFEDAAGAEEMFVNASKDLTIHTANDATFQTLVDAVIDIGASHALGVTGDHSETVTSARSLDVGGNQSIDVTGNFSDVVGGDCAIDVGGARMVKVGGDHVEEVGGSYTRDVGALQSILGIGGFQRTVTGSSTVSVGAAHAELVGGSRAIDVTGSFTESIGALKFIKGKGVSINADGAYMVNAAAVKVKTGAGRTDTANGAVALTAAGAIKIKAGGNVTVTASSRLVIRGGGCTITLTSAGTAEVKAATVIVKNAESLNQLMHKSN